MYQDLVLPWNAGRKDLTFFQSEDDRVVRISVDEHFAKFVFDLLGF